MIREDPHQDLDTRMDTMGEQPNDSLTATANEVNRPEQLAGYRCQSCDRAFYVAGNEEAYRCPTCGGESLWQLVGPFALFVGALCRCGSRREEHGPNGIWHEFTPMSARP